MGSHHLGKRRRSANSNPDPPSPNNKVCVRLTALVAGSGGGASNDTDGRRRVAHCSPGGDRRRGGGAGSATCLGELALPSTWWPPLIGGDLNSDDDESGKKKNRIKRAAFVSKQPKVAISVSYSVFEARGNRDCDDYDEQGMLIASYTVHSKKYIMHSSTHEYTVRLVLVIGCLPSATSFFLFLATVRTYTFFELGKTLARRKEQASAILLFLEGGNMLGRRRTRWRRI